MKDLNKMTAHELDSELSRLVHLRTAVCRITPIFKPQGIGFVNDIDGNELAHCTYKDVRDYIVTFDPNTVRGLLDVAIDAVSARLNAVSENRTQEGCGMKWIEQYPVAWRVALIVLCFLLMGYFEWEGQELFNNMTPLSVEAER